MLSGKGMWLWELDKTEADVPTMIRLAREANLGHILVKLTDGEYNFPIPARDPDGSKERLTHDVITGFRKAGITVWGWGFVYGSGVDIDLQAHRLAARTRQFDLDGVVINAEDYGRRKWSSQGGAERARRFMDALLGDFAGLRSGVMTALSSYRFPRMHPDFPFASFMSACDIAMPQVYWVDRGAGDARRNLKDSYEEYRQAFPDKQFVPTGAAFGEYYGAGSSQFFWSATPEQIVFFLDQCQVMGLPAVNFWSWQHARNDSANIWQSSTRLWDTIAAYAYPVAGQPAGTAASSKPVDVVDGADSVESVSDAVEVRVGDQGYHDGVYAGMPNASFSEFVRDGQRMKYALTSAARSGVWAAWIPALARAGRYEIAVWIPDAHGTTTRAAYFIHGVVGESGAVQVVVNQKQAADVWVKLGVYALDPADARSGMVNLNNLTGEYTQEIVFASVRWRPEDSIDRPEDGAAEEEEREKARRRRLGLADGFDSPVGTSAERLSEQVWPGQWFDATGFGTRYRDSGNSAAYHTGADLNLNVPRWNLDAGMPVYAPASGVVAFAGSKPVWNNIVIIQHDPLTPGGEFVCSRLAHLARMTVQAGQRVERGEQVGIIGRPQGGTEHLHFDISPTDALLLNPGDWPRLDWARLQRDYVDPRRFILENRPR